MGVEAARSARRAFLVAAAVTAAVAVGAARPGGATAAAPPPTPGISQYVETLPTSSGGTTNGSQATTKRAHPAVTPAQVVAIASSPAYGAPQSRLSLHPANGATGTSPASREDANAISAAVGAVDGNDDSRFIWLAAALLVITASAVGAATLAYRRRA